MAGAVNCSLVLFLLVNLKNTLCFPQSEADSPVFVAGDPERKHMEETDSNGGILYHANQIKFAVIDSISYVLINTLILKSSLSNINHGCPLVGA